LRRNLRLGKQSYNLTFFNISDFLVSGFLVIFNYTNLKNQKIMDAPRGYIQYRIMTVMAEKGTLTSREIRQMAKEIKYGNGSFDKVNDRGWYSSAFRGVNRDRGDYCFRYHGEGWISRCCYLQPAGKTRNGKYALKTSAMHEFYELSKKFRGMTFEEACEKYGKVTEQPKPKVTINDPLGFFEESPKETKSTSPEVNFRGLKLNDKVAYYRKKNGESGTGYISSVTTYSHIVINDDCFSISTAGFDLKGIGYDKENDMFLERNGDEIQIIKL
jgi:hypothetical protein